MERGQLKLQLLVLVTKWRLQIQRKSDGLQQARDFLRSRMENHDQKSVFQFLGSKQILYTALSVLSPNYEKQKN